MDCKVKIITDGKKGDIISQFVRFCKVFNAQIKTYGKTRKAVEETIRICRDENVLKEYLERQWEEVINMYMTLFDDETITRNHEASLERKAKELGRKEGREEGVDQMATLMKDLFEQGRYEDAQKAATDEKARKLLFIEFGLL